MLSSVKNLLDSVASFSESGAEELSPAKIPAGENTIGSNVNITYELR